MDKATSIDQPLGTAHGHRAIVFSFQVEGLARVLQVVIDFMAASGAELNGQPYKVIEAHALGAATTATTRNGQRITDYSHYLVS